MVFVYENKLELYKWQMLVRLSTLAKICVYLFTLNNLVSFIKHRGEENSVASELTNQLGGLSQHIV